MNKQRQIKTMRITGGKLVRQRFIVDELADDGIIRPTPDRVRTSIFAILNNKLEDAKVLDIFAGSGSHSFESISRGARSCTLIEKNDQIYHTLINNIQKLKLSDCCKVIKTDALKFIETNKEVFDVVFCDPPYAIIFQEEHFKFLRWFINNDSLLIFRCHKKAPANFHEYFEEVRSQVYAGVKVYFLKAKEK